LENVITIRARNFSLKLSRVEKSRRLSSIADAGNVGEVEWETL